MNEFDYWRILKWVLIVLLAGFIGQFGKSLAKYFMERARLKKASSTSAAETPEGTGLLAPQSPAAQEARDDAPAVALTGEDETTKPEETTGSERTKEAAKIRKKELKARAKQQKKAAQSNKNE